MEKEKTNTFISLLNFFGYEREGKEFSTYKGIYSNEEKGNKLVISDTVAAIFNSNTGDTVDTVTMYQDDEPENFSLIARLLYRGE